jgi:DNA primase
MYTEGSVQMVRDVAVLDVAQPRMQDLKRAGSKWVGLCPFHDEKTPSFTLTPGKNIFKCYGCQEGGDAIKFVMLYDKVEFIEAVEIIAKEQHITLEPVNDGKTPEQRKEAKDEKNAYYEMMEWACKLYELELGDEQKTALFNRGVTEADIKKWRIGYAPNAWRTLTNLVTTTGKLPMAVKLDLVKEKNEPNGDVKHYDTFRNRIMLPITDDKGRIIAFGAWNWVQEPNADGKVVKYINSAGSPIYSKSNALYGIWQAKDAIIKEKKAGITEGYFDVISAHRAGMIHVVASSGTALTAEHLKHLKKWSIDKVVLYGDNDSAGHKAMMRGVDMVLEAGMMPTVALYADKDVKDLDDVVKMAEAIDWN